MSAISVIIPTCARPGLLPRALASVAAQTCPPAEIIVVDDTSGGSGVAAPLPDTGGVPLRVVPNTRRAGASGARNAGAALARSPWLALLDDDDEWLPGYLATVHARAVAAAADVCCTDLVYRFDDGSERPGKRAPEQLEPAAFLTRNPGLIGSNLFIRRSTYAAVGGFDETLRAATDMDFGLRLSLQPGVRYVPLHAALVRHHQHGGPRLCMRRGAAMRAGIRRFYELHGWRMDAAQRAAFGAAVRRLWGVDEHGHDCDAA